MDESDTQCHREHKVGTCWGPWGWGGWLEERVAGKNWVHGGGLPKGGRLSRPERGEGVSCADMWKKGRPGREKGICKGPEVVGCLACLKNVEGARVAEAKMGLGQGESTR